MSWPPIQRDPCGGWKVPKEIQFGPPEQHYNSADNGVLVYKNTTTVPNMKCGAPECSPPDPCPDPIPPYARYDCGYANTRLEGDERTCAVENDCFSGYGSSDAGTVANTYAPDEPHTRDYAVCRKMGFKNVYAQKQWHGMFGFLAEGCCHPQTSPCCVELAQLTPDTTKYLTMRKEVTLGHNEYYDDGCHEAGGGSIVREVSVDRYSGKATLTDCSDYVDPNDDSGWSIIVADLMTATLVSCGEWVPAYAPIDFRNDDGDGTVQTGTITDTSVSYSVRAYAHTIAGCDPLGIAAHGVLIYEATVTLTLSDPYTSADLEDDVNELLAQWDLCDDQRYPWRSDTLVTTGPLVTRNERGVTAPNISVACDWVDTTKPPRPIFAEGAIIGGPMPPGYEPFWDFWHPTFTHVGDTEVGEIWEIEKWGAAAPAYIPHATQWIDNYQSQMLPPGAFIAYGVIQNPLRYADAICFHPLAATSGLMKCKWAEVIMPVRPTHNFARPCGATDKATADPATVNCDSNPDGDPRWTDVPCFCNDPEQTTDCDTPADPTNDYDWNDKWKKGEFTVDVFEYDFRAFWESYRTRMQRRAIEQRNADCVDHEPACDPEACDVPAQLDPFNYIERDDSGDSAAGNTIGTGTYYLKTMTREQQCVGFQICYPGVCYIQPDEPSNLRNGVWKEMPTLTADERYGTLWLARVNQWMTDPLWKAPGVGHEDVLCDEDCDGTEEDDGSCKEDYDGDSGHVCVYPMRNWEESLAEAPEDSPTLPAGSLTIGCPDFIANDNANPPLGNPGNCYPPLLLDLEWDDGTGGCSAGYILYTFPGAILMPWDIRLKQEECVSLSGRFADEYRKNGIALL